MLEKLLENEPSVKLLLDAMRETWPNRRSFCVYQFDNAYDFVLKKSGASLSVDIEGSEFQFRHSVLIINCPDVSIDDVESLARAKLCYRPVQCPNYSFTRRGDIVFDAYTSVVIDSENLDNLIFDAAEIGFLDVIWIREEQAWISHHQIDTSIDLDESSNFGALYDGSVIPLYDGTATESRPKLRVVPYSASKLDKVLLLSSGRDARFYELHDTVH